MDDIFICANSAEKLLKHKSLAISTLNDLGFYINLEKSHLTPSRELVHLGLVWNSKLANLSLPEEKILKIINFASYMSSPKVSVRNLAQFLGIVVNAHNGFLFAPLHYRQLQFSLIDALRKKLDWDDEVSLCPSAKDEILWWSNINSRDLTPCPLFGFKADLSLHTDASLNGWGASLSSGLVTSGTWSSDDLEFHINFLELKAVLLASKDFLENIKGKSILIFSDNTSTVYYLNNLGGTHSFELNSLAMEIWNLFRDYNVSCKAQHIAGKSNSHADFLSRFSHIHEYEISKEAFSEISSLLPFDVEIDMFASSNNKKLECFVSLSPLDDPYLVDAFSFSWPSNIYLFPPIPLISKVVHKIMNDGVSNSLLITPAWPSLPTLPIITKCLIAKPIFIPSFHLSGRLPTRHAFSLMAWPISAASAQKTSYQKSLRKHCSPALLSPPSNLTLGTGSVLLSGLLKEGIEVIFLSL